MKHALTLGGSLVASLLLSTTLHALPLSEYSLILEEDYDHHSAVWGRTFIGGNMVTGGGEFGTRLNDIDPSSASLTVVGDITGSSFNVMAGSLNYGGQLSATVAFNGGGSAVHQNQSALQSTGAALVNELKQGSATYANTTSNGNLVRNGSQATFSYGGSDSTAYFNVNANDLFTQNTLLQLNAGTAQTVIINVSTQAQNLGFDFMAPNGINFGSGFGAQNGGNNIGASNILWNFYNATTLDLQDLKLSGSLLAMGANLLSIGTIDGSIAAKSFIQDSQVHNYNFTPPSPAPLPASIQFMLMGLAGLFAARWHRKRKLLKA